MNGSRILGWFSFSLIGALLILFGMPVPAGAGDQASVPVKQRRIVAAGLGFQNADSSSITVKTYDADSGEVLSNDSYELDIKEEGLAVLPQQPSERIFAGGVGVGADGLSEFTLRVYDAEDGRFLWEGRLNLRESGADAETVRVAASIQPRAIVRRITSSESTEGQPSFLLRVMNPETGQLIWSDRFSTEAGNFRTERISRPAGDTAASAPQDIDFRIQMFDQVGGRMLWEDQVTSALEGANANGLPRDDEAGTTRQWLPGRSDAAGRQTI